MNFFLLLGPCNKMTSPCVFDLAILPFLLYTILTISAQSSADVYQRSLLYHWLIFQHSSTYQYDQYDQYDINIKHNFSIGWCHNDVMICWLYLLVRVWKADTFWHSMLFSKGQWYTPPSLCTFPLSLGALTRALFKRGEEEGEERRGEKRRGEKRRGEKRRGEGEKRVEEERRGGREERKGGEKKGKSEGGGREGGRGERKKGVCSWHVHLHMQPCTQPITLSSQQSEGTISPL